MSVYERVIQSVFTAIDEVNEDLLEEQSINKELDYQLLGPEAVIDSVTLVSLIAAVEAQLEDDLNVGVILADELAMSQKRSPFRSVGTLVDYATVVVEKQQ